MCGCKLYQKTLKFTNVPQMPHMQTVSVDTTIYQTPYVIQCQQTLEFTDVSLMPHMQIIVRCCTYCCPLHFSAPQQFTDVVYSVHYVTA